MYSLCFHLIATLYAYIIPLTICIPFLTGQLWGPHLSTSTLRTLSRICIHTKTFHTQSMEMSYRENQQNHKSSPNFPWQGTIILSLEKTVLFERGEKSILSVKVKSLKFPNFNEPIYNRLEVSIDVIPITNRGNLSPFSIILHKIIHKRLSGCDTSMKG